MLDPQLWIWLFWPTWNSGTVERMSMMMEARRNRELTITNTLRGGSRRVQTNICQSQSPQWISQTPWVGGQGESTPSINNHNHQPHNSEGLKKVCTYIHHPNNHKNNLPSKPMELYLYHTQCIAQSVSFVISYLGSLWWVRVLKELPNDISQVGTTHSFEWLGLQQKVFSG